MKLLDRAKIVFANKWQIPMAVIAVGAASFAMYRLKPPTRDIPFDAMLADVVALAERGAYMDAADAAANLLEMQPPLSRPMRARLHDALADVIYKQELVRGVPNRTNAQLLLDNHHAAVDAGLRLDGRGALRAARAHEWLGELPEAVKAYRSVLTREAPAEVYREALQSLVHVLRGRPEAAEERRGYIQRLLAEEDASPAFLWWTIRNAVQEYLDEGDPERAVELLTTNGQRLKRSDLSGYYDYLWARIHVEQGRCELAEPLLDRVDQWQAARPFAEPDMDRAGYLPALSRWLRGRIELVEDRPQEALASFDEVLTLQSQGDMLIEASVGRSEALGRLQRHSAAREALRSAFDRLKDDPGMIAAARPRLREQMMSLGLRRQKVGDYANAIECFKQALGMTAPNETDQKLRLLDMLGAEYTSAAQAEVDRQVSLNMYAEAARCLEQAAELTRLDEKRYARLIWDAADRYDSAGRLSDARRMLTAFIAERSSDSRTPRALLRLGQVCAAQGLLEQAVEYYDRLIEEFPRLDEAARARGLKATCLVALGDQHFDEAERVLRELLSTGDVTPRAGVFRDALYELCDLLYQQRRYSDAVAGIEEFLEFYPGDPEAYRLRFMLADAYRGSAFALLDDDQSGSSEARAATSRARLLRAAELFDQCLTELEQAPDGTRDRDAYVQLALFNRGDCLYELNDAATLREALGIYRMASARYQGSPAVLSAQVRIANIYLRQGKVIEAARALERARWLLGGIPDGAFEQYDDMMDRAAWEKYLDAVQTSDLFAEAFSAAP